jgi:hypothetical protein
MPTAKLDPRSARSHLQEFRFADLFVDDLGWNHPSRTKPLAIELDGVTWHAREISQLSGFRVIEVTSASKDTIFPDAKTQNSLWKRISPHAVENILIFADHERTRSVWLWMKRDHGKTYPRRHYYLKSQPGDLFLSKLASLVVDLSELDEEGNIPITDTAERVRAGLDIEAVTKRFFSEFAEEHDRFLETISGIPDGHDQRWYASVILNRLMFIWFLQKKAFLDNENRNYLPDLLAASAKTGKDRFYSHTLRDLFFEGFAKPASRRACIGSVPLGDIPYLNGGLFLPHGIETRIEGDALFDGPFSRIRIPDAAFEGVFRLFSGYSWSLNDTPGGDDREINPDVLGYIFEKYINQKEFGAYYTRPEITEYLCEQTIHQLVLEAANKHADAAGLLHKYGLKKKAPVRRYETMSDLLLQADGTTCRLLLQQDIPTLSLLDPACGSGAFLVAAMKTLLGITTGLIGRCEAIGEKAVLQWIETEKKKHKAPLAYWLKKKIITENLYGVDIMEEAVEIAKLRLFLALVASAEKRDQLEPLPNIEFNLMPGNSLIGLLHVNQAKYDRRTGAAKNGAGEQRRISLVHEPAPGELGMTVESKVAPTKNEVVGAYLAEQRSARYEELLREKNRLVAQYKQAGNWAASGEKQGELKALTGLRDQIEAANRAAREILNKLLLDEFSGLGIKFQQATWDAGKKKDGKPEKRDLRIDDIRALHPFHWAYEFDEIMVNRGGFDAVITNPPWENFKPDDKEFFMPLAGDVTKNKMRLEDFVERKTEVLASNPVVREKYLAYLSRFPHVNLWFRNTAQYENQTAIVNGRKATTDLNLYKLFLEQSLHLLHAGGYCGIVIPGGIYSDLGATRLRQMLFEKTRITGLFGFENRKEIFENVHRSFKFVVLTFRPGDTTTQFPAAFMRLDATELTSFPENGSLEIEVKLIRQLSPDSLSFVEFHDERDVAVARKLTRFPLLGDECASPWNLRLHREFHMTDDAALYHPKRHEGYVPLVEGKMFHQFCYPFSEPRYWVDPKAARAALLPSRLNAIRRLADSAGTNVAVKAEQVQLDSQTYRLAFRAIARNTDERTMIATVLPPNVFCPHSVSLEVVYHDVISCGHLSINKMILSCSQRLFLAAILNSFVFDFQLRQKVSANVSFFYIYQLSVPHLTNTEATFRQLVDRASRLVGTSPEYDDLIKEIFGAKATHKTHAITDPFARQTLRAEIDALVARLYDLTEVEFAHVLGTFPLVDETVKTQTLNTYRDFLRLGKLPDTRL